MNNSGILYGVVGLLAGVILAGFSASYAVNNNNQGMMRTLGIHTNNTSQGKMDNNDMSMSDMTASLKNKTGDDFDKAFMGEMIIHHQGAIDMAKLAQQNAKHGEIKTLATAILAAQSKEIDMMQTWQTQWGYKTTPTTESHSMMGNTH